MVGVEYRKGGPRGDLNRVYANREVILSGGVGDLNPNDVDLVDGGGGPNFFADDLGQIFEDDNIDLDRVFDKRPNPGPANDVILVME